MNGGDMPKIISLDLDGTLLKEDKTISKETLKILERAENAGKYIVINTGRPRHRTESVLPAEFKKYIWICSNGGDIFHGEKEIRKLSISAEKAYALIKKMLEEFPEVQFGVDLGYVSLTFRKDDIFYTEFKLEFMEFEQFLPTEVFSLFLSLKNVTKERYEEILLSIPEECRVMKTDLDLFATVLPKEVSKFSGIENIAQELGCTTDDVLAFGDDINDL